VRVLKNRYSGEVGVATRLTYDLETCQFYETDETKTTPVFDASTDF
jgi:twinkle protein